MPRCSALLCRCSCVLSSLQIIGVFLQGQERGSCNAVCAQPRPPPNVRAVSIQPVLYQYPGTQPILSVYSTSTQVPPCPRPGCLIRPISRSMEALAGRNFGAGHQGVGHQGKEGKEMRMTKMTMRMKRRGSKRNLEAASELHWRDPHRAPSQPHFSGFFPHQSDTRLHQTPASHFHSDYTGIVFMEIHKRALLARIIMLKC